MSASVVSTASKTPSYPIAYRVGSALLLAWAIWLLPAAAIDAFAHLAHWKEILLSPIDSLADALRREFPNTWIASLPASTIGFAYVAILVTGLAYYTWDTVRFYDTERERLRTWLDKNLRKPFVPPAARIECVTAETSVTDEAIRIGGATAGGTAAGAVAGIGVAGAAAAAGGGLFALGPGIAAPAIAAGPIGWLALAAAAVAAVVVGGAIYLASSETNKRLPEPLAASAPRTDAQLLASLQRAHEDQFQREASIFWDKFEERRGQDLQKMLYTGLIIALLIFLNYCAHPLMRLMGVLP